MCCAHFVFRFGLWCVFFVRLLPFCFWSLFLSSFVFGGGVLCLFVCLLLFRSVLSMCEVCPIFEEVKISASRAVAAFVRSLMLAVDIDMESYQGCFEDRRTPTQKTRLKQIRVTKPCLAVLVCKLGICTRLLMIVVWGREEFFV